MIYPVGKRHFAKPSHVIVINLWLCFWVLWFCFLLVFLFWVFFYFRFRISVSTFSSPFWAPKLFCVVIVKTESQKRPCFRDFNPTKPSFLDNARLILPWPPLHDVPTIWETGTEGMFLCLVVSYLKIERALLLAERSVCVRVCKHGCGVKMFAFRALITQGRIWKGFRVQI